MQKARNKNTRQNDCSMDSILKFVEEIKLS